MDTTIFWTIYGLSHHSVFFDALGVFFAEYAAYVWAIVLLIVFFWSSKEQKRNRMMIYVGVFAAVIARFVMKAVIVFSYHRPRPFMILEGVRQLISISPLENLQSFPSGHAIFFFALATVIYYFNKKVGLWAFGAAAFISTARVYAGVHWPSDILCGAILGILTGWLVYRYYKTSRFYV